MIRRDADGLSDRGDAPGASARGTGMGERGFGILIEEFAGRDQVARHDVGGRPVQSREFTADFGRQLLGFDLGGNRRTEGLWRFAVGLRLGAAGAVGPRSARRRTPRMAPVAAALSVLSHVRLSTLICQFRQFSNLIVELR